MPTVPVLPSQPLPRLFLLPVDSQLHQFLVETHRIVQFEPAILDHIEADLDAYGLKKKLLREADQLSPGTSKPATCGHWISKPATLRLLFHNTVWLLIKS